MHRRHTTRDVVLSIAAAAVLLAATIRYFRPQPAVNVHDPEGRRIDAFAIQEGEFGVAVRVRFAEHPAAGAEVWADPRYFYEEDPDEPLRRDTADDRGLVTVPVRKNAAGR